MTTPAALLDAIVAGFAAIPLPEWVAVVLALVYLLLAVRQNAWCWVCAIASSALFLVLFAQGGLVMQAVLQLFYIAMGVYGWRAWRGGGAAGGALPVSRWTRGRHVLAVVGVIAAAAVNGRLVGQGQGGWVPYADALVAWGSVLATVMVTRKVLENWLYWITLDSVAAVLYWTQGFHATAVLFVVYVVIAVRGYFEWRAGLQHRADAPKESTRA
jgi:nicotinamide mononucleotide transporter